MFHGLMSCALSFANTCHDVKDLELYRMVRNTKHKISQERNMTYDIKRNFPKMEP